MAREKKVEMPTGQRYSKNMLRIIYRRMKPDGIWGIVCDLVKKLKFSGVKTNDAWVQAIIQHPFDEEVRQGYFREMREKREKAGCRKYRYKPVGHYERATYTGIPLIDWVYTNLTMPNNREMANNAKPTCYGDRDFLLWARNNQKDFFNNFFKPALLKKFRISDSDDFQPPPPANDAPKRSTAELMESLEAPKPEQS